MRNGQLEKMSLKELLALEGKIKAAIDEKRVSERAEMRSKMEEMAGLLALAWLNCSAASERAAKLLPNTATRKTRAKRGAVGDVALRGWLKLAAIRSAF